MWCEVTYSLKGKPIFFSCLNTKTLQNVYTFFASNVLQNTFVAYICIVIQQLSDTLQHNGPFV